MAAVSAPLRHEAAGGNTWILLAAMLVAFGGACGVAIAVGEMAAFYVALSLVTAMAVLFDFRIGAFMLVLLLPFGATLFFPRSLLGVPGLNPQNVVIVATLVSAALRRQLGGLPMKPLVWLYVVPILAAGLLGLPHVKDIPGALYEFNAINYLDGVGYYREAVIRPLLIVVVAVIVGNAVARSARPEVYITSLIVAVWIIALIEILFIASSGIHLGYLASALSRRFFSEMGLHANDLGRMFAVAYAILLFTWWETKHPTLKFWLFLTLGVASLALVMTFSRSAYLAFFIVNGLFLLWKFNAKKLALALGGVAVVSALAPGYLWRRITFGFDADANAVSADRIDGIWTPLVPYLGDSPLWGKGIDSILWAEPMRSGEMLMVGHPHNAYLQAYLDMGLIGLALLIAFYWHVWKGFRSLGSNPYLTPELRGFFQGATAALLCLFVTGVSGGSLRPDVDFAFLWVAIGMMYGVLARKPGN